MRVPIALHCFPKEFQRCLAIPCLRDEAFQNLAFMINGTPAVMLLAIDLNKNLVQMATASRIPGERVRLPPSVLHRSRLHRWQQGGSSNAGSRLISAPTIPSRLCCGEYSIYEKPRFQDMFWFCSHKGREDSHGVRYAFIFYKEALNHEQFMFLGTPIQPTYYFQKRAFC